MSDISEGSLLIGKLNYAYMMLIPRKLKTEDIYEKGGPIIL